MTRCPICGGDAWDNHAGCTQEEPPRTTRTAHQKKGKIMIPQGRPIMQAVENPMVKGADKAWEDMNDYKVVCVCEDCNYCISEGETYYELDNGPVCESCMKDRRREA